MLSTQSLFGSMVFVYDPTFLRGSGSYLRPRLKLSEFSEFATPTDVLIRTSFSPQLYSLRQLQAQATWA
jgi:hypothetical protein